MGEAEDVVAALPAVGCNYFTAFFMLRHRLAGSGVATLEREIERGGMSYFFVYCAKFCNNFLFTCCAVAAASAAAQECRLPAAWLPSAVQTALVWLAACLPCLPAFLAFLLPEVAAGK